MSSVGAGDIDLPGLSGDRRPIIAGGVLVLEAVFAALGLQRMYVSKAALREGVLYDLLGRVEEDDPRDASVAAMLLLEERLGFRYGGSSGTNLVASLQLAARMRDAGRTGSIVTLLCDRGARYRETLYDAAWRKAHDVDAAPRLQQLRAARALRGKVNEAGHG